MARLLRAVLPSALVVVFLGTLLGVVVPTVTAPIASAHVERPSYWPNPKADCTVSPCAGGKVPTARSLWSALDTSAPGQTRVVCKANSLRLLERSITSARRNGYLIRVTERRQLSAHRAARLLRINEQLLSLIHI